MPVTSASADGPLPTPIYMYDTYNTHDCDRLQQLLIMQLYNNRLLKSCVQGGEIPLIREQDIAHHCTAGLLAHAR